MASDWHRWNKLAWPDENYARENLQLHSIGLVKLNDDGTPVLDRFGNRVANYEQKHIFEAAKVWTSFSESYRRGNYEDLDWATTSYLDPLQIKDAAGRDWFPKVSCCLDTSSPQNVPHNTLFVVIVLFRSHLMEATLETNIRCAQIYPSIISLSKGRPIDFSEDHRFLCLTTIRLNGTEMQKSSA